MDRKTAMTMADKLPFLPFALPDIGDEEIAEVVDTLKSGWVTTGPKARRFEEDFSAFLNGHPLPLGELRCTLLNQGHNAKNFGGLGQGFFILRMYNIKKNKNR